MTVDKTPLTYTPASPLVFPREDIPEPPRAYPAWLKARLADEDVPIPESVILEYYPVVVPSGPSSSVKIFGGEPIPPAKYVPPPEEVKHCPKMMVRFKVLNAFNQPISSFKIRANDKDLITNENGGVSLEVYKGHPLAVTTGVESGWSTPLGATRRVKMVGMVPMAKIITVDTPRTIHLFPESGQWNPGNGIITYADS